MFKHLFTITRRSIVDRRLGVCLSFCLIVLALSCLRQFRNNSPASAGKGLTSQEREQQVKETAPTRQLVGREARQFLQQPGEGESLMQAINTARFGLKRQERGPFGENGAGYLGMSHVQNLNAWFAEDGVTVRPTVAEEKQKQSWHLDLRLKAYGYGNELEPALPIVSQHVKDNRIEYERSNCQFPIANCQFKDAPSSSLISSFETPPRARLEGNQLFQSAIGKRQSTITEWYENRAEGIEQGFTVAARPARNISDSEEPLRLLVSLNGDLTAQGSAAGETIELKDRHGNAALSYGKLTALDAAGKQLAAHMEAGADGTEIALVVDDRGASYPIVIDPIVASLQVILDGGDLRAAGTQFGDAVAIDGDRAVVGEWLSDNVGVDAGLVLFFSRSGSTWSIISGGDSALAGAKCGYSVATSGTRAAFGCAGANGDTGKAYVYDWSSQTIKELLSPNRNAGDLFGASVAVSGDQILVGAPGVDVFGQPNAGAAYLFTLKSDGSPDSEFLVPGADGETRTGASVAIEFNTLVVGSPGTGAGSATIWERDTSKPGLNNYFRTVLRPGDGATGDLFGTGVTISGNTVIIGAPDNDEKGADAGAAYVFVRNATGQWGQQQKLTASDGKANDIFSYNAVALEGNTIVVGSRRQDLTSSNPNDNSGAAYIFTRNGTVWSQQTKLSAGGFYRAPGDEFGTSVGISGKTVIVGAPHETATNGTVDAGVTYVYSLDCTPPAGDYVLLSQGGLAVGAQLTVCPGSNVGIGIVDGDPAVGGNYTNVQWRKNGINIPGATGLTYVISGVSAADAGSYDAILSNACGAEITSPATLTLHTFSLNLPGQNFGASGSNGSVNVTSTGMCAWTAVSNATSFITVTSGASGTGNGTVNFTVAGNTGPNQRTGSITIAGKTFTVSQDGLNCSYSIAPTAPTFTAAANAGSVNVTATAACAWTAVSNDNWLTITSGSGGAGNGAVNYSLAANTGPARTGTLTVAGQTVTVTQANGCTYLLSSNSQTFPASVAAGAVSVTSVTGCAWTATSNAAFISVTSGANGTGNGSVGYSLTANDTTSQRSGTLTIAGQTFTVTQDAAAPSPTPTPTPNIVQFSASSYNVNEDCTTVTITVNRIGDTSGAASVDYNTADVIASERRDYTTALGKLRFAPGETAKSFVVLINEDSYVEGPESFNVNLSNPSGVGLGAAVATVQINDDPAEPAANSIDDPATFVGEHYHDFLNRQADTSGLAFWTNEITSCGTDPACIQLKRVNVSAAYFLSIEFQQTGYLVERLYKTAYGSGSGASTLGGSHQLSVPVIRLQEFLRDTQQIGQGVIVGQAGWESALENNKQSFINDFMQQSRFNTAFPSSLTAAQLVDALNANAGSPLSTAERNQLVNDLSTGAKTRAQVLRSIAEHPALVSAESNRAFVLMQFFGYLRRNPNDSPDADYTGYDFWLAKLNQFNGNFVNAEMVKAFITSSEYRGRFGQ